MHTSEVRSGAGGGVLEFYGLREQPFGSTPDPRFTYLGRSYREALASVCIALQSGQGLVALVAPPGLGKTMLLFQVLEYLKRSARTVFVFNTQCDGRDLLRQIVAQLGDGRHGQDAIATHGALVRLIRQQQQEGRRVVLVVDEAHNLEAPALETIRLLSDLETPNEKLLQIVLAGQPPLAARLLTPELAALRQRISTLARIGPLTEPEASAYVRHRLKVGGQPDGPVFDEHALRLVAQATAGVPREINTILSSALFLGRAEDSQPIGRRIIQEVLDDHDLGSLCPAEAALLPPWTGARPALASRAPAGDDAHAPSNL